MDGGGERLNSPARADAARREAKKMDKGDMAMKRFRRDLSKDRSGRASGDAVKR